MFINPVIFNLHLQTILKLAKNIFFISQESDAPGFLFFSHLPDIFKDTIIDKYTEIANLSS